MPNFLLYYWIAIIRPLLYWLNVSDITPSWVALEEGSIRYSSLTALVCSTLLFKQAISSNSQKPIVIHTLKIWYQFRQTYSLINLWGLALSVKNHLFALLVIDDAFNNWSNLGIKILKDLFIDVRFALFQERTQTFKLDKLLFILQIFPLIWIAFLYILLLPC